MLRQQHIAASGAKYKRHMIFISCALFFSAVFQLTGGDRHRGAGGPEVPVHGAAGPEVPGDALSEPDAGPEAV